MRNTIINIIKIGNISELFCITFKFFLIVVPFSSFRRTEIAIGNFYQSRVWRV